MPTLKSAPKLTVTTSYSPSYDTMGIGEHSNLFLLGHADGLELNEPVKVAAVEDMMSRMNSDPSSPLLKGMLEAYYAGARDIWVMAVAPMSEYYDLELDEPHHSSELTTRYEYDQAYKARLDDAYRVLEKYDTADIVVPIGARFNDYDSKVDYLTQLGAYCHRAAFLSGNVHLGILGTFGAINQELLNDIAEDQRIIPDEVVEFYDNALSERWANMMKYVSVFAGDVIYTHPELPGSYRSSSAVGVAAVLSQIRVSESVINKKIRNAIRVVDYELDTEDTDRLSQLGINPVIEYGSGRDGDHYRVRPLTDNTLAEEGSSFWSSTQLVAASTVLKGVRQVANAHIGNSNLQLLKAEVKGYLTGLVRDSLIRDYTVRIERDPTNRYRVLIDLYFKPFFALRDVTVSSYAGPSQVGE